MVLDGNRAALQKTPRKSQVSGVEIVSTETIDSGCENSDTLLHSNVLWESVVFSDRATPPGVISTTLSALHLLWPITFRKVVAKLGLVEASENH